jgi:hypothetical protein
MTEEIVARDGALIGVLGKIERECSKAWMARGVGIALYDMLHAIRRWSDLVADNIDAPGEPAA